MSGDRLSRGVAIKARRKLKEIDMPREGEERSAREADKVIGRPPPGPSAATLSTQRAATLSTQRVASIDQQIAAAQLATSGFEKQQRAFESQIAALAKPSDPSQFGQPVPDLSFTSTRFAPVTFDRTPPLGVGLTTAMKIPKESSPVTIEAPIQQDNPLATSTLRNIQSRLGGEPRSVPRGIPKKTTTRASGVTTTAPEGIVSPVQRVLGDRTRSRLGGQGKF